MFVNVNCVHFERSGHRCVHRNRPKWLFLFKPMCIEPEKLCNIKEMHKKPTGPPPAPQKHRCCAR